MPISKSEFPGVGHEVLSNSLSELRVTDGREALGGALEQVVSDPLPVYSIGLAEAANGDASEKSDGPIAWRYMLFGSNVVSFADLDSGGSASESGSFNRVTEGKIVDRLYKALLFVDETFSSSKETYEIRILEIPSLNQAAIWLKSEEQSIFIPYLDADQLKGASPSVNEQFLQDAAKRAKSKLSDRSR